MAKYIKSDSEKGFVEDYVDIQTLKFDNVRHSALGNMLGDFDDVGNYVVQPEIVKELISMPKYVVEVMDNLEVCLSVIKFDKQLSFLVAFEGERATLSLIEKVSFEANNKLDGGMWSNVNEYILDVVETNGQVDRQALYMRWNIQAFPGMLIDIFNCDDSVLEKYFNIVNRIKFNMEAKSILLDKEEELEEIESEYAIDLFEILFSYPSLKKLVGKQLKTEITSKKNAIRLDRPYFAKAFNEILNRSINDNISVLSDTERVSFETDKRNIKIKSNIKKYECLEIEEEKIYNKEVNKENSLGVGNKVLKIKAAETKYKSFEECAEKLAKKEIEAESKSGKKARDIFLGKNKTKLSKVIENILGIGVKREDIASKEVVADVAAKEAEIETAKKEDNKKENEKSDSKEKKTDKKEEKKKEEKKKEKKKEKEKEKKKEKKPEKESEKREKKEEKSSSGAVLASSARTPGNSNERGEETGRFRTLEELEGSGRSLIGKRVGKNNRTNLVVDLEALEREKRNSIAASTENKTVTPIKTVITNSKQEQKGAKIAVKAVAVQVEKVTQTLGQ